MCLVGVALLVLLGCCLVCFLLLCESAWWNRGIAEEVTMASYGKAVTGTAVMARSANGGKKKKEKKTVSEGAKLMMHLPGQARTRMIQEVLLTPLMIVPLRTSRPHLLHQRTITCLCKPMV